MTAKIPNDQRFSGFSSFRPLYEVLKIEQLPNLRLSGLGELGVPLKISFSTGILPSSQKSDIKGQKKINIKSHKEVQGTNSRMKIEGSSFSMVP